MSFSGRDSLDRYTCALLACKRIMQCTEHAQGFRAQMTSMRQAHTSRLTQCGTMLHVFVGEGTSK